MHTVSRIPFTTVKTEGSLLPPELLARVAEGRARDGLEGLRPEDYHLFSGERLNEAVSRSWSRCISAWRAFNVQRARLPEDDSGVTLTRERWLLILFAELGYGRLPFVGKLEASGTTYPISHRWEHAPIHLVSFRQELERRDDVIRRSPHSLIQEYLNRAGSAQWGFVSNGLRLRLLRDNASLTRAAYVEFDLDLMMEGELYADFSLLWLVCHQSRVEDLQKPGLSEKPGFVPDCWLERWSQAAEAQGTRALAALRDGVKEAIEALGRGFLAHRDNNTLRRALQGGTLSKAEFYRQLLRLVYRLIILFVAEDRELFFPPDTSAEAKTLYQHYSVSSLRELAAHLRGGAHFDLYQRLGLVFDLLGTGYPALGVPPLGGFLFSPHAMPDLNGPVMSNADLLDAVRALAFVIEGNVRRNVDYRNLDSEELGSVYESLLELHPQMDVGAATFNLELTAGSERKTSGSHYTATSLVEQLLDSALEPIVAARLAAARTRDEKVQALLHIRVLDYACGSGHILVVAARRLARHLAQIITGDQEPAPGEIRTALREVVGHCIFGVDVNPLAVELCKVALWMESLDPGKPLTFLDHHIKCGNSLVGAAPWVRPVDEDRTDQERLALPSEGQAALVVPDDAFAPVAGDHKPTAAFLRKLNRTERSRNQPSMFRQLREGAVQWHVAAAVVDEMPDDSPAQLVAKEDAYRQRIASPDYRQEKQAADLWTAAFFWPIREGAVDALAPTHGQFARVRLGESLDVRLSSRVEGLADQLHFFHWELEFESIFRAAGFDCVLSNPPWEALQVEELQFFASRAPQIAAMAGETRKSAITELERSDPELGRQFAEARHAAEAQNKFLRASGRFVLTASGKMNTYALFAELAQQLLAPSGRTAIIVPTGIATDDTTKTFFGDLVDTCNLVSLYDFENRAKLFSAIDSRMKFCLLTIGREAVAMSQFAFFVTRVQHLADPRRRFTLSPDQLALFNPNSRTCPIFRTRADADLALKIYRRVPALANERTEQNLWGVQFMQGLFNMTSDSAVFLTMPGEDSLALYEAKMIAQYDHRNGSYETRGDDRGYRILPETSRILYEDPGYSVRPFYWVPRAEVETRLKGRSKWLLGFKDITSATNERTVIFSPLPLAGVGHTMPLAFFDKVSASVLLECFLANLNSLTLDYIARQKVGGLHLAFGVLNQLPVLAPTAYTTTDIAFIAPRVLELVYTAWDIKAFADDLWRDAVTALEACRNLRELIQQQWEANTAATGGHLWAPPAWVEIAPDGCPLPPFKWNDERRAQLRADLDAYYARLYSLTRDELRYILDPKDVYGPDFPGETFRVLKEKEEREYGEYRTRRLVLAAWDRLGSS